MGAVIDSITQSLPRDVPVELFVAWAVWLLGGLLLMLWFTRRSGASRIPPVRAASAVAAKKSSGTHAAVRPASGTHAVARPSSATHGVARSSSGSHAPTRTPDRQAAAPASPAASVYSAPKSNGPIPDAYSELSLLLDSVEEQSRSNS